jgi:long-chain fatty acid transport protein
MGRNNPTTFAIGLCFFNSIAFGGGFQLYNEGSAEALGQAAAITARDDLVSLAWYNPAGLAGTEERSIMVGNTFALLKGEFDGSFIDDEQLQKHWISIPHVNCVMPIDETKTFTFSLNSPFGLTTEWPSDGVLRNLSEKAELMSVFATPSLAFKINDQLSVSAGFNAVYISAELSSLATSTGLGGSDPNIAGQENRALSADGFGLGATAALRWALTEDWALGARYQSQVRLSLDGTAQYDNSADVEAETNVTLPDSLSIGLTYAGFERWKLGFDAVWTDWADFDELSYEFPSVTSTVPQEWKTVWALHLGAEYQLTDAWVLRGGYIWDQSPISDKYRSPMLPGNDRQLFMTGFGYTVEYWTFDAAYCYIWVKSAEQGTAIPASLAGEYDSSAYLISLSVSYRF